MEGKKIREVAFPLEKKIRSLSFASKGPSQYEEKKPKEKSIKVMSSIVYRPLSEGKNCFPEYSSHRTIYIVILLKSQI